MLQEKHWSIARHCSNYPISRSPTYFLMEKLHFSQFLSDPSLINLMHWLMPWRLDWRGDMTRLKCRNQVFKKRTPKKSLLWHLLSSFPWKPVQVAYDARWLVPHVIVEGRWHGLEYIKACSLKQRSCFTTYQCRVLSKYEARCHWPMKQINKHIVINYDHQWKKIKVYTRS